MGSFEDKFDHDPNTVYEDETDDDDFLTDEEFDNPSAPPEKADYRSKREKYRGQAKGCFIRLGKMLFKMTISCSFLYLGYLCAFKPADFQNLLNRLPLPEKGFDFSFGDIEKVPESPRAVPVSSAPVVKEWTPIEFPVEKTKRPFSFNMAGSGILKDFKAAQSIVPELEKYEKDLEALRIDNLSGYRPLIDKMILVWAQAADTAEVEKKTGLPYAVFYNSVSKAVLRQTVLRDYLTVENGKSPDPVRLMAALYKPLREVAATKPTVREQLKAVEPVTSYLFVLCGGNFECQASWDLMIEMIGFKPYAGILEKTPEKIYEK